MYDHRVCPGRVTPGFGISMRKIFRLFIFFVLPLNAHAGEGRVLLDKFLTETQTMSASFSQTLKAADGELLQESAGRFYLQRPGKFRWTYTEPYPQEIVSDGARVWIYDVDLAQVTVQKQGTGRDNTPMALLQNRQSLEQAFEIHERGTEAGLHRIELVNRQLDTDFDRVVIGLDQTGLRYLQLHDQFDQTTQIFFRELRSNPELEPGVFEFTPPEGVDVFGGS